MLFYQAKLSNLIICVKNKFNNLLDSNKSTNFNQKKKKKISF